MTILSKLAASGLILAIAAPSALARMYPDDFLPGNTDPANWSHDTPAGYVAPVDIWADTSTTSSSSSSPSIDLPDMTPSFFPSDIPSGPLTRGDFIDALGSRLYDTDAQGTCFGDLVSKFTADYSLLFSDVNISQPLAISVCVAMKNGLVQGSKNNMFHANNVITAAEVAAVFSRLSVPVRNTVDHEPWYQRYMETMSKIDPNFTSEPGDVVTGAQLKNMMCVLKRITPQLDPMNEFNGC